MAAWKTRYSRMNAEDKANFDQDIIYTLYVSKIIDLGKKYTTNDVKSATPLTLERALRLLHRKRFGREYTKLRIHPYLDYSAPNNEAGFAITDLVNQEVNRQDLKAFAGILGFQILTHVKTEPRR